MENSREIIDDSVQFYFGISFVLAFSKYRKKNRKKRYQAHLRSYETAMLDFFFFFAKIPNSLKTLIIFAKNSDFRNLKGF